MKKFILASILTLVSANTFANSFTCVVIDHDRVEKELSSTHSDTIGDDSLAQTYKSINGKQKIINVSSNGESRVITISVQSFYGKYLHSSSGENVSSASILEDGQIEMQLHCALTQNKELINLNN
jgi:hypothetical protein